LQADQLLRERSYPIDVSAAPPKVHHHDAERRSGAGYVAVPT
jgi:hypothetical protein